MPRHLESSAKVLVVDDSDIARASVTQTLRSAGYDVIERNSPLGASRDVIRHGVSIVVLDVEMPALRGDRLATLLRGNGPEMTLVLVSSLPEQQLRELGEQVGADGVVPKARATSELVPLLAQLRAQER